MLIAKSYTFRMDGGFRYYAADSTGLATPVDERGTYEIERYLLRVKYNDGTSGVAALVYRPDLPVLFLSGLAYTAR